MIILIKQNNFYFSVKLNFQSDFQEVEGEWTSEIQILLYKQTWKYVSVTDFGDLCLLDRYLFSYLAI